GRVPPRVQRGVGAGFVGNADGYVVTNNHVVDGATEIRVKLADGRELAGRVVGRDPRTDLALLKVDAHGLPTIPLGDSAALKVGEPVMAIGNPFGLEQTVTTGIVSATGRVIGEGPYDDFIQTDASINPGNSGGPLTNGRGQAVGINTAIVSRSGGSVGIGFAIPVNLAKPVVSQLASAGHVTRGWLGVGIQPLTADLAKSFRLSQTDGALVTSVSAGSPAAKAGLKQGDVIVEYDGRPVGRAGDLPRAVAETPVGRAVPVKVVRDGKPLTLTATVGRLEEAREAKAEPAPGEPALGVTARTLTPTVAQQLGLREQRGVLVVGVNDGSRAEAAGLKAGDIIAEVDHRAAARDVIDDLRGAGFEGDVVVAQWLPVHRLVRIFDDWPRRWEGDPVRAAQLRRVVRQLAADHRFLAWRSAERRRLRPRGRREPPSVSGWYCAMAPVWLGLAPEVRRQLVLQTHVWIIERVQVPDACPPPDDDLVPDGALAHRLERLVPADDRARWRPWID